MLSQMVKEDMPILGACGGLVTFCTIANVASIMQALGIIAAGLTAIIVLIHRIYVVWKDITK